MKQSLVYKRLVQPVIGLLTQGVSPEKIALSLAVGIVLGIFPVMGSTTLLCAAASIVFRLNLAAIQLVNYLVYPLQLILIVPFIRAGELLLRARPLQLSLAQMLAMAKQNLPHAISVLWLAALHAVVAWLIFAPVELLILYFPLVRLVRSLRLMAHARLNAPRSA